MLSLIAVLKFAIAISYAPEKSPLAPRSGEIVVRQFCETAKGKSRFERKTLVSRTVPPIVIAKSPHTEQTRKNALEKTQIANELRVVSKLAKLL